MRRALTVLEVAFFSLSVGCVIDAEQDSDDAAFDDGASTDNVFELVPLDTDSGQPATDSGQPATDGGQPATDSGQPATDSGQPATDSGQPPTDTGPASTDAGDPSDPYDAARQACVDKINALRGTLGLAPLARWRDKELCADGEALSDSQSGVAHGAFGACGEWAQNECPGWPSVDSTTTGCLDMMWAEGPGEPYSEHGHYINMTNTSYTKVACGFTEGPNGVWALQNFQ